MQQITINLHGVVETKIFLHSFDAPMDLPHVLGLQQIGLDYLFLHRGKPLTPALSYASQGVNDNDDVYIVQRRKKQNVSKPIKRDIIFKTINNEDEFRKKFFEHYGNRFRDTDTVFEQMLYVTHPKTTNEFARITDLFKMRVESNPVAFRRICKNVETSQRDEEEANRIKHIEKLKQCPTVLPQKALSPSTDLFPLLTNPQI